MCCFVLPTQGVIFTLCCVNIAVHSSYFSECDFCKDARACSVCGSRCVKVIETFMLECSVELYSLSFLYGLAQVVWKEVSIVALWGYVGHSVVRVPSLNL